MSDSVRNAVKAFEGTMANIHGLIEQIESEINHARQMAESCEQHLAAVEEAAFADEQSDGFDPQEEAPEAAQRQQVEKFVERDEEISGLREKLALVEDRLDGVDDGIGQIRSSIHALHAEVKALPVPLPVEPRAQRQQRGK